MRTEPDDPADDEVFRSLYGSLRRFAAVTAPVEVDPDDLLQEALVATLRRHHLTDLESPAAYLRRAMVNLAANHRRRLARERKAMTRVAAAGGAAASYPSDLSDLMSLSPRERAVLFLTEVEGYRFDEVAEMVGCSAPAARMSATRGRRRRRAAMTEGM